MTEVQRQLPHGWVEYLAISDSQALVNWFLNIFPSLPRRLFSWVQEFHSDVPWYIIYRLPINSDLSLKKVLLFLQWFLFSVHFLCIFSFLACLSWQASCVSLHFCSFPSCIPCLCFLEELLNCPSHPALRFFSSETVFVTLSVLSLFWISLVSFLLSDLVSTALKQTGFCCSLIFCFLRNSVCVSLSSCFSC